VAFRASAWGPPVNAHDDGRGHPGPRADPGGDVDGDALADAPPSTAWLVGHTTFGAVLLLVLTALTPEGGLLVYLAMGAVAVPVDAAKARQPRRATTWPARVGWALLLPFYALGMVVHGLLDLASSF
jgi:hypothetical protein